MAAASRLSSVPGDAQSVRDRPGHRPAADAAARARRRSRAPAGSADEVIVVDGPAGLSVCAARNAGAERATGEVLVFVDSDVEIHAGRAGPDRRALRRRPGADRGVRLLRRRAGARRHGRPRSATCCTTTCTSAPPGRPRRSGPGWARCAGTPSARSAASTRTASRTRRSRTSSSAPGWSPAGARIRLDPAIQGTHLKAWTLALDGAHRLRPPRRAVGGAAAALRPRPSTALNLGWRHRVSAAACSLGALALLARRPAPAPGSLLVLLGLNRDFYRLLARRRGPGAAAARGRACTRAPPDRGRRGAGRGGQPPARAPRRGEPRRSRGGGAADAGRRAMTGELRIGLIGGGRLAELGYLPALRAAHGVRLVALAELDPGAPSSGWPRWPAWPRRHPNAAALLAAETGRRAGDRHPGRRAPARRAAGGRGRAAHAGREAAGRRPGRGQRTGRAGADPVDRFQPAVRRARWPGCARRSRPAPRSGCGWRSVTGGAAGARTRPPTTRCSTWARIWWIWPAG